jgi:hypothetical protein
MRLVAPNLVLMGIIFCAAPACAGESADINQLIVMLGSNKYAERNTATLALDRHGAAALKALQLATQHADPEVRHRAHLLVQRIEHRLTVSRLLSGTKIRLVYKDVDVLAAINDLSAKAGFPIEIEGDRLGVRDRKLTLDTGETTFWEAFNLICTAAGLSERVPDNSATAHPANSYPGIGGFGDFANPRNGSTAKANPHIALLDSKTAAGPTFYAGALRLRAVQLPGSGGISAKSTEKRSAVGFHLEMVPEPRLAWFGAVSHRITKAIDDQGQELAQPEPYLVERFADALSKSGFGVIEKGNADPRVLPVRLEPGKKAAKTLKEVHGTVAIDILGTVKSATIENIISVQGKRVACADGGELRVLAVASANGHVIITVQYLDSDAVAAAGPAVRWVKVKTGLDMGRVNLADVFILLDAKGEALPFLHSEQALVENGKGDLAIEFELKFQTKSQQSPAQLIFSFSKRMVVNVPFTLRDVPLVADPQALPPYQPPRVLHLGG